VISASVDADCVAAMREAGVDDWVEKPFTRQRLIAALHEWLPVDERLVRG
jgi:CheY-like chemotaxis protein